jgi:hypothetical protein
MILNSESYMIKKNIQTSDTFKNLGLTGFSAAFLNYKVSSNKANFFRKYSLQRAIFLKIINQSRMVLSVCKQKCFKLRKLRNTRLSTAQLRRKFRKLRRKLRKLLLIRKKKYQMRKLRRFFRRKKKYLRKWKVRLTRHEFNTRVYKNNTIQLKIKRLLFINKFGLTDFFGFIRDYNLLYTRKHSLQANSYRSNTAITSFQLFFKNTFSFFINFKNTFFLKNIFF